MLSGCGVLLIGKMTTKVRIKATKTPSTQTNLLGICYNNNVKITKVRESDDGYLVFCSSVEDVDALFTSKVQALLSACSLNCVMPPEVRAKRSVIVRGIDSIVYRNEAHDIMEEIRSRNTWADVVDVFKFPNSNTLKIQFSSCVGARRCVSDGLSMFFLHISGGQMVIDEYIHIPICYKCYSLDDHQTSDCTRDVNFKLCSLCASEGHDWKGCRSSSKKCVNCEGSHHTLSMQCPRRRELIKIKRQQRPSKSLYSAAVGVAANPPGCPTINDNPVVAKSVSCILLALLSSADDSTKFSSTVNQLFLQNGLPTLNLSKFTLDTSSILRSVFNSSAATAAASSAHTSSSSSKSSVSAVADDGSVALGATDVPFGDDDVASHDGATLTADDFVASVDVGGSRSAVGTHWENYKCFKTKETIVKSRQQLLSLYDKGKIVITHVNGNVVEYTNAVNLIKSCKSSLPVLCDMKPNEFKSFSASPARYLRSNSLKK